ncbi:MAG: HEAT repeat domain-containing protein [Deltaproteobacteria bacterium]|nr:HEAT repeat domain-containing protein [Deltaproteobacteria bacterium]
MSFLLPLSLPHADAAVRDASSPHAETRWVAALALAGVDESRRDEAVAVLVRLVADDVPEIRAQSLAGLASHARSGAQVPSEAAQNGLRDPSSEVRLAAIDAAAVLLPGAEDLVAWLLEDPEPEVRLGAALALASFGDGRGKAQLEIAAHETRGPFAAEALTALAGLGSDTAVAIARSHLARRLVPLDLKAASAVALARLGHAEGVRLLREMLDGKREAPRLAALAALANLPCPEFAAEVEQAFP